MGHERRMRREEVGVARIEAGMEKCCELRDEPWSLREPCLMSLKP